MVLVAILVRRFWLLVIGYWSLIKAGLQEQAGFVFTNTPSK